MSTAALEPRLREAIGSIGGHMDVWAVSEDADLFGAWSTRSPTRSVIVGLVDGDTLGQGR